MHQRDEGDTDGDGEGETYRVDTVDTTADSVVDPEMVRSGGGVEGGGKEGYGR